MTRDLDIVLFGATGFTGKLVAEYLAHHAPAGVAIALAGRSRDKLERVRAGLPAAAATWPLLVADSADPASLGAVAGRTKALITTVGPYARLGLPLVEACARQGTHYVDLTGEVQFIRDSIDRFDAIARQTGARIVHSCGFDSIPSDLGVWVLHEHLQQRGRGEHLGRTTLVVEAAKGGFSGGTIASMFQALDEARTDRTRRRMMADPYALSPDRAAEPDLGPERDLMSLEFDPFVDRWVAPFVMAAINTRVVRRSNALLGHAYGRSFRYREVTGFKRGLKGALAGAALTGGMGLFMLAASNDRLRPLLERALPKQGEGPTPEAIRDGFFRVRLHAETEEGVRLRCLVVGQRDPGYGETSKMLSESALALVLDTDRLPDRAGVLTPASALGGALRDRLVAAGMTFAIEA